MRGSGPPAKPAVRRPLRTWFRGVYILLVFGGFLGAPENEAEGDGPPHPRLRALVGIVGGGMLWIFPVTFMIAMAWGCESHARQLGRRAQAFYGGEASSAAAAIDAADRRQGAGHGAREIIRGAALPTSIAMSAGRRFDRDRRGGPGRAP